MHVNIFLDDMLVKSIFQNDFSFSSLGGTFPVSVQQAVQKEGRLAENVLMHKHTRHFCFAPSFSLSGSHLSFSLFFTSYHLSLSLSYSSLQSAFFFLLYHALMFSLDFSIYNIRIENVLYEGLEY